MKRSRSTENQIVNILKEADANLPDAVGPARVNPEGRFRRTGENLMRFVTCTIAASFLLLHSVGPSLAAATGADTAVGVWKGQYICGQTATGLTLSIEASGDRLQANFSFYPVPGAHKQLRRAVSVAANGEFSMLGEFDSIIGEVNLRPDKWIRQPSGYQMVGLKGLMSKDGQSISGSVNLRGCQQFELERTSMTVAQARAERDADKPSPENVRPLKSVRSAAAKCDVLLSWMSRLELEYPTHDMDRMSANQGLKQAANLYRNRYFLEVFDKPYSEMSAGDRKRRVSSRLANSCTKTWREDGRRNGGTYGFVLTRTFTLPNPQFDSMVATKATAGTWMDRVLSAAASFPADDDSIDKIESYLASSGSQLAELWPSEQESFVTTLRARQKDIASGMLQHWTATIATMAPTVENAAVIQQELAARRRYFDLLDPQEASAIQETVTAKLDEILRPVVDRELAALDSWPNSLAGAAASVAWHRQFSQSFARFGRTPSVRSAERHFSAKRSAILDAARNEFAAKIDALPLNPEAGRRASSALNETLPLTVDKSLPAYKNYQEIVVNKLNLIENAKFDAQVASLLSLQNQSSGLQMDGYTLPGLISGIYQGQIGLLPDDLEQTRPQVAGLVKAMNDSCGEAPADVGLATITYIAPNMDDVMMESLQGFAEALQSGDLTKLARQSRVASEGFEDGVLLVRRQNDRCASSVVRRFRSNLNDLILARYRRTPQPYNQRLFSALLSADTRARYGLPNPMSAVVVANKANLVQQYEREIRQTSRSPAQLAEIEKIKRNCNNLLMNMRGVCDAAAKCGEYFVYFHPEHRKGERRYQDVFTVSNTPPDADVQTIQELWSYTEQSMTMSEGQEFSRGKTIPRNQLKPVLYAQKFGDYYGSRANLCKPYRPGELSCSSTLTYCTER
jgi:hypothetical protein